MINKGLLIKKGEICKLTVTNYESKEVREIEIKNGEITKNIEGFKLIGHKTDNDGYFLESIVDDSNKFLGKTKSVILTSKCEKDV